jgi:DNA-binding transcriptional regulator LsrR (DeoR family)
VTNPARAHASEIETWYYDEGYTPRELADRIGLQVDDVVALLQADTSVAIDADMPDIAFG